MLARKYGNSQPVLWHMLGTKYDMHSFRSLYPYLFSKQEELVLVVGCDIVLCFGRGKRRTGRKSEVQEKRARKNM
jgi:hypothetical protein